MSNHTPLPWRCEPVAAAYRAPDSEDFAIVSPSGVTTAIVFGGYAEGKLNAAFLIRACNSHDALLEACKALAEHIDHLHVPEHVADMVNADLDAARAALAAAEGGQQ